MLLIRDYFIDTRVHPCRFKRTNLLISEEKKMIPAIAVFFILSKVSFQS